MAPGTEEDRYELTGPSRAGHSRHARDALRARAGSASRWQGRVAQLGAVLGRTFAYELLRAWRPWTSWSCGAAWCNLCELRCSTSRGYRRSHVYVQACLAPEGQPAVTARAPGGKPTCAARVGWPTSSAEDAET